MCRPHAIRPLQESSPTGPEGWKHAPSPLQELFPTGAVALSHASPTLQGLAPTGCCAMKHASRPLQEFAQTVNGLPVFAQASKPSHEFEGIVAPACGAAPAAKKTATRTEQATTVFRIPTHPCPRRVGRTCSRVR
jgi:hypothetical protein